MAGEDSDYLSYIRKQPCCACGGGSPCEAHHNSGGETSTGRRRGLGEKAHDHDSMPLHIKCHADFHRGTGWFAGWDHAKRRAWQDHESLAHWVRYVEETPGVGMRFGGGVTSKVLPRLRPQGATLKTRLLEGVSDWLDRAAPLVMVEGARQAAVAIVLYPPLPGASEFRATITDENGEHWLSGRVEGVRVVVLNEGASDDE